MCIWQPKKRAGNELKSHNHAEMGSFKASVLLKDPQTSAEEEIALHIPQPVTATKASTFFPAAYSLLVSPEVMKWLLGAQRNRYLSCTLLNSLLHKVLESRLSSATRKLGGSLMSYQKTKNINTGVTKNDLITQKQRTRLHSTEI